MKSMNENLLKQEERKIKRNLVKITDVTPTGAYKNLYKKPSSVALFQRQCDEIEPSSSKVSTGSSVTQFCDHLPKFSSYLQQPSKKQSNGGKKKSKNYVPFSSVNLSMSARSPKPPDGLRVLDSYPYRSGSLCRRGSTIRSQEPSNISIQEAMTVFPSLQRLSGDRFSYDKTNLNEVMTGFPAFARRLKELLVKAWEEEARSKRASKLPNIRPDDVLRCRYLRLSESNISTLLQLCEDSGLHIDIHPHMKECDINVDSLMSPEKVNTVSL
ncbi:uncharacterized protein C16orf78 homolog [Discoglossus pictus]